MTVTPATGFGVAMNATTLTACQRVANLGATIARVDTGWNNIELSAGVYTWTALDAVVSNITTAGLRPCIILDYNNTLYAAAFNSPVTAGANMTAWMNWATATVDRYKNQDVIWEIWNEPNSNSFWYPPDSSQYIPLCIDTADMIKVTDPTGYVIAPALSEIDDLSFIEDMLDADVHEHIDAFSVHPYVRSTPENALSLYEALRTLIDSYSPDFPILDSEWGWSDLWAAPNYPPVNRKVQAKYFPRKHLLNLMFGARTSVWFSYIDTGSGNEVFEDDGFGVYDVNGDPKPVWSAAHRMSQHTHKTYNRNLAEDAGDYVLLLDADGEPSTIAYWTTNTSHSFTIPVPGGGTRLQAGNLKSATPRAAGTLRSPGTLKVSTPTELAVTMTDTVKYLRINYQE